MDPMMAFYTIPGVFHVDQNIVLGDGKRRYEDEGLLFEYLEGKDLGARIDQWLVDAPRRRTKTPFTLTQFEEMASQITSALAHCHQHNVVYRDLKPGNVMLTKNGDVRLIM